MLDFSFLPEEKANALRKAKEFFNEEIMPQLDQRFDEIETDVYIEKLEIDIGKTTAEDFAINFQKAFAKAMDSAYMEKRLPSAFTAALRSSGDQHPLLYFLEKGYWSWNFQTKPGEEIIAWIAQQWEKEETITRLLQQIEGKPVYVAERLINLVFSHMPLRYLFIKALKRRHAILERTIAIFEKSWLNDISAEESVYAVLLKEIVVSKPLQTADEIKGLFKRVIETYINKTPSNQQWQAELQKLDALLQSGGDLHGIDKALSILKHIFLQQEKIMEKNTVADIAKTLQAPPWFIDEEKEKINVGNAGLVLFHPYLPYVFRELKWVHPNYSFKDIHSQHKAILFLQYLINGKSRQAEHELVLNKILCNWPYAIPLPTRCNFSRTEKQAADELIDSLKEHWKVLNTTSRAGVIKSFVERKAIIQKSGHDFLVQVEKNTIDILMESLPFGIQTIKLPWNEYFIHTEWAY